MKQIDLKNLKADPLVAARMAAGAPTATVKGRIRTINDESVCICLDKDGSSFVEYPRSAIAAAFVDEDDSDVTLLVHIGADVRIVRPGKVRQPPAPVSSAEPRSGCNCENSGSTGITARRIARPNEGAFGGGGLFTDGGFGLVRCRGGFCTCDSDSECNELFGSTYCGDFALCFDLPDGGVWCICNKA